MSLVTVKFWLTLALFGSATVTLLTMLTLMGREERSVSPGTLRTLHRAFGYIALVLAVVVGVVGYRLAAAAGASITHRAVLHATVAGAFFAVFLFKVAVARHYRQFLKYMPALGLIAFALLFAVVSVTAGFRIARVIWPPPRAGVASEQVAEEDDGSPLELLAAGDVGQGGEVFAAYCSGCYAAESTEYRVGPGLMGLADRELGERGTREDAFEEIVAQVLTPTGTMPAFESVLSDEELADLLAYLDTL